MAEILYTPVIVIHVAACLFLILVVLLQPGKSGGMGAFTGAGATQVFGGRGAGNLLTRATWITATSFFLTSVVLAFLSTSGDKSLEKRGETTGIIENEAPARAPEGGPAEGADPGAPEEGAPVEPAAPTGDVIPPASESTPSAPDGAAPVPAAPVPTAPVVPVVPPPVAPRPAAPASPAAPRPAAPAPADPYGP